MRSGVGIVKSHMRDGEGILRSYVRSGVGPHWLLLVSRAARPACRKFDISNSSGVVTSSIKYHNTFRVLKSSILPGTLVFNLGDFPKKNFLFTKKLTS